MPRGPPSNAGVAPGVASGGGDALGDTGPPFIWHKYMKIAEEWDKRMMEKWKTNMGNLLVFAALFTAIVTTFALDAMSHIQEDTSTQLLRVLVQQSITDPAVDIPQSSLQSSSIVTVSSLWFLSIMCSLAATTWAVLSLEWCAILTADVPSEDYEETAERKQRNYEAIRRWKMHIIVASIPFVLHISIFLFLAGLWLRLRDVNRQLELIVGISSLVIGLSYVIVTLLPTFTGAPFRSSVSEVISVLVNETKYLLKLRHFLRPPPVFKWISKSLNKYFPRLGPVYHMFLHLPLRAAATLFIHLLHWIHRFPIPPVYVMWTVPKKIVWAISPAFPPGRDPLRELSRLQAGPSGQNRGVHQRALFRLMNTHLNKSEAMDILKEWGDLRGPGNVEEHLDRTMVKLLVSSLSSVLWDGKIAEWELPIFDHCTMLLAEGMGRVFHDAGYDPRVLVWKPTAISDKLKEFVDFKPPALLPLTSKSAYDDYWNKVVRLLWLSPSEKRIRTIIKRLEPHVRSMRPALLQRIVRGLHAATLTSLFADKQQSIIHFPLPDFSRWDFSDRGFDADGYNDDGSSDSWSSDDESDDGGPNDDGSNNDVSNNDGSNDDDQLARERLDLNGELSAFLHNLLVKLYKTTNPDYHDLQSPTTIPELVVALYKQGNIPLNFQSALRLFITTTWRSNPNVFDTDPSVAQVLVTSIDDFIMKTPPNTPDYSKGIAVRLHTIAYGPHVPSESIANLYSRFVKDDPVCLSEFIHVTAAALEAVLAKESLPGVPDWRFYIDRKTTLATIPLFYFIDSVAFNHSLEHPDCRLPYLYSLAITLSHGIGATARNPLEVFNLFEALAIEKTSDAKAGIEGTLDPNATIKKSDTDAANEGMSGTNAVVKEKLGTNTAGEGKSDTGAVIEKLDMTAAIERMLDTNVLVVNVVRHILSRRGEAAIAAADVQTYLDPMTRALDSLWGIIGNREAYPWRTRWKAIYLLVDIINVLPRPPTGFREHPRPLTELQSLIDRTSEAARSYLDENAPAHRGLMKKDDPTPRKWRTEPAPHDWRMKREELKTCGLEEAVKKLAKRKESTKGVYSWREPGNVPYLSLYPQRMRRDPTSRPYWFLEKLQRFVDADIHDPPDPSEPQNDRSTNV